MFTKRFALTRLAFLSRFTRFGGVTPRRAMQTVVALGASILFTTVSLPLRAQGGPTVTFQTPLPFLAGDNPVGPAGLAFDHSGNLFMSDYSNARVVELPAGCASTSCETVVPNLDLGAPIDVALDAAGDLFIADFSREMVYELPAGQTSEIALGTGWGAPSGISVDSAGDVWVADFLNNTIVEIPWNGTIFEPQITVVPNTWLNGVFGVALDKSNNVFIADSGGQQIVELPHGCTLVSCLVPVATNLGHPQALVADSSGNIFFVDTLLNYAAEVPTGSFGCASTSCLIYFAFGLNEPHGVAVDASDDVFIGDYGNGEVWEARPNPFNFGTISVGSKSAPVTAYFSFGAPTTLGSTPYQVLTQGKSGGDIAVAAGSTCAATSYVAGSACAVTAQFAPSAPGLRMGAVQLNGSSGNPIATAPIYGTGSGPQVVFPTNSDSTTSAVGSNFNDPYGVALDGSGDVFVADTGNNAVDEIVAVGGKVSSGSTVNTVSSVFNDPYGVAVDGSGDVFVADTFNNAVREIVAVGGQVSPSSTVNTVGNGFSLPTGVAVDSLGDVFVADYGNTAAKEIVAVNGQVSSASTVIPVGSGFTGPTGVAVDAAGDVFVADNGNNAVDEIVAVNGQVSAGSTVKPVGSGFSEPFAVTVDAAGDVFVADFDNNAVKEIFAVGGQVSSSSTVEAQGSGFTSPIGVALDASGDVFVADASFEGNISSQVTEIPLATPSALAFPTITGAGTSDTNDDPLDAVVANDGNATLTFNLPATGDNPSLSTSNFTLDGSSTCTQTTSGSSTPFTLAEGAYCILAVDFTPKATGTLTDNLSLTDNTLYAASATQELPLSGTAADGSTIASPTPGGTLTSASTTFTWNAGPAGTTGYGLNIGTTGVGSANLVNIGPLSGTSTTVTLPTNGTKIYVRLWTIVNGTSYLSNDYTYTEFTRLASAISSPTSGSTLTSASTTFTWNAGPAGTTYGLNIGTTGVGSADLVNISPLSGTSTTVTLPTNGTKIYVRLWTIFSGSTYVSNDYTYTEFTRLASAISSPTAGSTLTSASTTFTWNAGPAGTTYGLNIGTTAVGSSNLVNISPLSGTSTTVTLPTNGAKIYVRLWTIFNGTTYVSNDYTYTEFTRLASAISSPTAGSTLTSASTTFTWNAGPAGTTYGLNIGTTGVGSANLVNSSPLSGTSATVTLPTNGTPIYVRLWTIFNGTTYVYNDYTYTEFTQLASAISSPTPGSTLTSASTTFTWNAGPAGTTGYGLNIGTTGVGSSNLVNISPLSGTSTTVTLPTNGTKIYVRLWTIFNGTTYVSNDYTYTEF